MAGARLKVCPWAQNILATPLEESGAVVKVFAYNETKKASDVHNFGYGHGQLTFFIGCPLRDECPMSLHRRPPF